ncbi:MAG: zinc metallopeptidase [Chloroflexi bacterium]|nr:zinc metallopeptidase [Chloroflexota bacterium]
MFFDPLYLIIALPALLLGMYAQARVKSNFNKYAQVRTSRGFTGAQVAKALLNSQGLYDVQVEETQGFLSDHYDPRSKTLRLSPEVYRTPSVAAAGIAAHEMGHALQHASAYMPLQIRSALVPAVQFSSNLAPWIIIGGMLLQWTSLAWLGVILFGAAVVFSLITLPVEFDASRRAKQLLVSEGVLSIQETEGVNKVLDAAALTYVAAAIAAVGQLIYWVLRLSGASRRD